MKKTFWHKLKKPIFVLAPMADVTDTAFRQIIAKYGKPDVFFTEFVSCDGLCSEGRKKLERNLLEFDKKERPLVAQVFGSNPENFYKTAKIIKELGFDGIDINMGCPQDNVVKQGAGSALIRTPELAKQIIRETKRGAGNLPVSVKTRVGYNKSEIETWIPAILEEKPVALTIHGRTRKEMSKVPAHWDLIKRVREIRDEMKSDALVLGNGDISSITEATERIKETGVDGVMVGRGIYGNPWLFSVIDKVKKGKPFEDYLATQKEKMKVALEHTKIFEKKFGVNTTNKKLFGGDGRARSLSLMKKHFKAYVNGFSGAKELRIKLMEAESLKELEVVFKDSLDSKF